MKAADPLSVRATFLQSIPWDGVVLLNQAACAKAVNVAHGLNKESAHETAALWEKARGTKMTLPELLEFLRGCHKRAPFLNFNGNVFGEIARQIVGVSLIGAPVARISAATSMAAHCVAGVVDQHLALEGIRSLLKVDVLEPGDTVTTLKFTRQGKVLRALPDGRVAWLPEGRKGELVATPDSLVKLKPGRKLPDLS